MSGVKLKIKIFLKAIFHSILGKTRLKAWILRAFSRDYELDSAKLAELISKPILEDTPKGDFIASLTSFPARVGILKYALHSIFSQDLQAKRVILVLSKDEFLDSAESQNLNKKVLCETPENSPASWCKKSGEASSSASADFLLEADKRGSPPKSEKRQLLGIHFKKVGGSGAGGAALLREKTRELNKQKSDDFTESTLDSAKSQNLQSGLPRRFCDPARNDEFILDSANLENLLPAEILAFKKFGLEIMWVEKNLRQYNKIIPILRAFPRENIITLDDDIYYNPRTFSTLYNAHLSNKRIIWAHKARIVPFSTHKIADFFEWKIIRKRNKKSQNLPKFNIFLEGCGGVFYPPNALHSDCINDTKFMDLAPKADDIWLWAMALLKGTKIACVKPPLMGNGAAFTNSADNPALWHYNMNGGNDKQMCAILAEYPQILRILAQEKTGEKS